MDNATVIIKDALGRLKCGACEHYLGDCRTNILGKREDYIFVQCVCRKCKASFLIILYQVPEEEFKQVMPMITEEYQMEMGKFLKNYQGDIGGLLNG